MRKRRSSKFRNQIRAEETPYIDVDAAQEERRKRREEAGAKSRIGSEPSKRKKTKLARRRLIYATLFIACVAALFVSVIRLSSQVTAQAEAQERLDALKEEQQEAEQQLKQVSSDEYIEEKARSELHMVKPGDVTYVLKDKK